MSYVINTILALAVLAGFAGCCYLAHLELKFEAAAENSQWDE